MARRRAPAACSRIRPRAPRRRRATRLVCLRRARGIYRAFVAVDEVRICVSVGWNVNRGWLTLPDCVAVRQDGAGRRTRPPSRNALSAVFQREGARFFFPICYLSFRTVLCSSLSLNGGDCFCLLFICLFIGVAGLYCFGSDEGSRETQTASSWAEQSGERKGMDQELEPQVRPF